MATYVSISKCSKNASLSVRSSLPPDQMKRRLFRPTSRTLITETDGRKHQESIPSFPWFLSLYITPSAWTQCLSFAKINSQSLVPSSARGVSNKESYHQLQLPASSGTNRPFRQLTARRAYQCPVSDLICLYSGVVPHRGARFVSSQLLNP